MADPEKGPTESPREMGRETARAPGTGVGGLIAGIVIGAFIGAGVALLLAPDKGARTRRRLGQRLSSVRDEAMQHLDDATLRARRDLLRRRKRLRKQLERGSARARERLSDLL